MKLKEELVKEGENKQSIVSYKQSMQVFVKEVIMNCVKGIIT